MKILRYGKELNENFAVYQSLFDKARANVNILLDDDAVEDAKNMYFSLNTGSLKGRLRFIECPSGYDASLFYQKFGKKGMYKLLRSARQLNEYELL